MKKVFAIKSFKKFEGGGKKPLVILKPRVAYSVFAALFGFVFLCALCFFAVSCGGGGGGGGGGSATGTGTGGGWSLGGGGAAASARGESIPIGGGSGTSGGSGGSAKEYVISFAGIQSLINLNWQSMALDFYINGVKTTYNVSPSNPTIKIQLATGDTVSGEAKIVVPGGEKKATFPETVIQKGDNQLTFYVEYTLTYSMQDGMSLPAGFETTSFYTSKGKTLATPTITVALTDPPKTFDGWYASFTAPDTYSDPVNTLVGRKGDLTLYAKWREGEIVYNEDNYSAFGADATPFVIKTPAHLNQIAELSRLDDNHNFSGKKVLLDCDIIAQTDFPGLGNIATVFAGTFDGQGHTVTLSMNSGETYVGFINNLGGTVQNLKIAGKVTGVSSARLTAGVVACLNYGTITRCANTANVQNDNSGEVRVGGIAGESSGGTIDTCYNKGTIVANGGIANNQKPCLGGIVGYHMSNSTTQNVYHTGTVATTSFNINVGGIFGTQTGSGGGGGTLKKAYTTDNLGSVQTQGANGSIGYLCGGGTIGTVQNVYCPGGATTAYDVKNTTPPAMSSIGDLTNVGSLSNNPWTGTVPGTSYPVFDF